MHVNGAWSLHKAILWTENSYCSRKQWFKVKNVLIKNVFILNTYSFSLHKILIHGPESCGLLWCFYQLFGLSYWWHSFTEEDPFVSKWCKATNIYIYIFFFFLYSDSQSSLMLFWTPLLLYEQNSSTVESKSYMNDMMVSKWCYNLNFWVNFPSLLQLNRHNCWVNINILSVLMAAVIEYICSWEGLSCRTQGARGQRGHH